MAPNRETIVRDLVGLVGPDSVVTDEDVLRESSIDRFRMYEGLHGIFTRPVPAALVLARSRDDVVKVLSYADEHGVNVVPRTGNTGTEGGLETAAPDSIVLDGSRMDEIVSIDPYDMQATCQCGVPLQVLEDKVRAHGLTTGHSPQSKPVAQMGGLVATRSIGQFSTLYGGIEDMVVGLEAVFPDGSVARIKNVPRRATGPDLRHIVIGNEGTLCFITEVTVKLFPYLPENNVFVGWSLDSMKTGFEILREVMVSGYRPSVARLYDPPDADLHFAHFVQGRCVLIFMAEGPAGVAAATAEGIREVVARYEECDPLDPRHLAAWFADLNWGPDKIAAERDRILQTGNINRTTEVAAGWRNIHDIYENALRRIVDEIPDITMAGGHSSHSYVNGTNMYFNYFYNVVGDPEEEVTKYHTPINKIICEETLRFGGSIVHHHGMGKARTPWVREEYGTSFAMLERLKGAFDPHGIMNQGTIIPR